MHLKHCPYTPPQCVKPDLSYYVLWPVLVIYAASWLWHKMDTRGECLRPRKVYRALEMYLNVHLVFFPVMLYFQLYHTFLWRLAIISQGRQWGCVGSGHAGRQAGLGLG